MDIEQELTQFKQQFYQHKHTNVDQTLPISISDISGIITGQASLVAGVITINNSKISTNSIIYFCYAFASATIGILYLSNQQAGSFQITSKKTDNSGTQTADISLITYMIIN